MMNDNNCPTAPQSRNEELKQACPTLAGTISATLADPATDHFSDDDAEFLKFHGIYQSDDRDQRKTGKTYRFLVRARVPGGALKAEQYLVLDRLADRFGNGTLRCTSRQTLQLHGVIKSGLGSVMKALNDCGASTLAACGDVARNVMAPSAPSSPLVEEVRQDALRVSQALLPQMPAYQGIWTAGPGLEEGTTSDFVDPLYGKAYLPRKFKVAFAVPPLNDVDVFTHCLGFVAIAEQGRLLGYDLLAGGGMGMSFGNPETYARLGDVIGFLVPGRVVPAARALLTIHRDFGDRANRKHARLKYVIQERGVDWLRNELNQRLGFKLEPARPFEFTHQGDLLGWQPQYDGNLYLGTYIECGRIGDSDQAQLKTALRAVVEQFRPEVRLTPSQNLLLTHIRPGDREAITRLLAAHGVNVEHHLRGMRRTAMACPALPTCGRALAEAERALPRILREIEQVLAEIGLAHEEITLRVTGCPNGCDRPRLAELGLIGKAPNKYQICLGGDAGGTRLNRVYREGVKVQELVSQLRPLFVRYAQERSSGERFGDYCQRVILRELEPAR